MQWCYKEYPCTISLYNIHEQNSLLIPNNTNYSWGMPVFHPNGQEIAITAYDAQKKQSNLAIIKKDGSDFRLITKGEGLRGYPSFSRDGKWVIYSKNTTTQVNFEGKLRYYDYEIFKVSTEESKEIRLTQHNFFRAFNPYFIDEDNNFIFEGIIGKVFDTIYTLKPDNSLKKISFNEFQPASAHVSNNYTHVYLVNTNDIDNARGPYNYDLYIKDKNTLKRLTQLSTYMCSYAISPNGENIAFFSDKERSRNCELFIMESNGENIRKLNIPRKPKNWDTYEWQKSVPTNHSKP